MEDNSADKELNDILAGQKETPEPPATPAAPAAPTAEPAPAAPATPAKAALSPKFWADADIEEPEEGDGNTPDSPEGGKPGISKKAIDTGARTAVAMIDFAQGMLFRPLINYQAKRVCTKRLGNDLDKAIGLVDGEIDVQDEKDKVLKAKLNRLLKAKDKKYADVPFTPQEEKDLTSAFALYFETKQITMSPEVLLYTCLISTLGNRVVDVAVWD